jgi:hypothetical protein
VPVSAAFKAPEAKDSQDGDEDEDSLERTSSMTSPPPTLSEDLGIDKKRKRVEEFTSSSASTHKTVAGETSAPEGDVELFNLMDSCLSALFSYIIFFLSTSMNDSYLLLPFSVMRRT